MLKSWRHVGAAILPWVLGWASYVPQASAQLPCLPGILCNDSTQPTVSITAPSPGATVTGTITVTASASDDSGVAGVQFQLDGASLGAEDASAPYSISWDTATVSNGSHTLTAVARDAAGNQATSNPVTVTVSNAPPPPAATRRFEESDPAVSFGPGWIADTSWFAWSGGGAVESMTPGAQATFAFSGSSATWIGVRGPDSGIARVYVDGALASEVDLFARSYEIHVPVFTVQGLPDGNHTLTIEVTGLKNPDSQAMSSPYALVVVDAFDAPAQVESQLQDTDPDMIYSAGWTGSDVSRSWSGWYGHVATAAGAQAALPFNGTGISWIGYRGPDAGIARVYLDGVLAGEVDLYYPDPRVQAIAFTAAGLADADHVLTIEATGLMNENAAGARVVVDAFSVTRPGTRYEQSDPSVAYSGLWEHGNLNRAWSMGTMSASNAPGATAAFTFTGSAVSWIGSRKSTTGIARVYMDGSLVAELDTYAPTDGLQQTIFEAAGLAPGAHTLTLEVTGQKNPAASSAYIVVDAFDVRP